MMFNNVAAAATNTELYYSCSNYNTNGYYSNSMMGHEDVGYYNRRCLSLRTATRNNNDHSSYAPVTQSPLLESLSRSWYNGGQDSEKSKPVCITKISPAPSSDIVTVTDNITTRQTTRNKELLHKPAKTESSANNSNKRANRSTGGGRHLQPPSGNNSKLKHECPFDGCPWRFATPYKLRRHIKSHTKETPYQCKECGRGFSVRYNLLMHIQTIHSTPHKYKCPIADCKDAFHTQPRLNGHLRKIHKKDWKQLQLEQGNATGSLTKKASHDQNDTPTELGTVQKWYKCIDCSKEFTSQAKLSAHMKAHSGNFPCTVQGCSRSFQSSDKLTKHLESSHKSLPCPNVGCNRMFLKQSQLKNHIRVHTNSKYTCTSQGCNMKFDNEADYKDHLNIHLGYSIQCPHKQCMLTFPTEKRLELHYRVAHLSNDTDVLSTSHSHPSTSNQRASFTNGDNFMDTLELPDLKVEDVEAVMSEHTNWTGDQIETFLKSLDIEELDCNSSLKSSLSGYESDSGYSTHEVSPLCVNTRYGSALSPAITPVTPSPILSSPTSLSSPVPLCLYHDEMFPQIHPPTTPSNDQQFFTTANLSLLSQVSQCPTSPDHTFTSGGPALCHNKGTNNLSSFPTSQLTSGQSIKSCVQSVLPPISNMTSDIEANRHNVTIIPNTFCNSSCITVNDTPTSITVDNNVTNDDGSIPPHFDTFLDNYYLNILGTETGTKPSSNVTEDKYSNGNCEGKDPLDVLQFMDATTQMCSANDNIGKVGANTENGGVVIAQILSPTKQTTLQKNYRNAAIRSAKGKSKVRHHSASVVMKGHQKGKKKSTWPKSMNSGNLMAFRNFILGKLKTVSPCSFSNTQTTIGIKSTQSLPSTPVTFMPSDDFINDIRFNPDVLLSSEQDSVCFSPFSSCHSGSISPSPIPLSPSLESSMQFTSLSSLTSDASPCPTSNGNLGIDGFIHCLSLDPITQGLDQQLSFSQHLSDEFSGILKTDADPLLGGLT